MYIIDTSVIICGALPFIDGKIATIKEVIEESKDYKSKVMIDTAIIQKRVQIKEPTFDSIKKVKDEIRRISCNLSETDTKLIALTFDHKDQAILLSDDYSVQNIASLLNLEFSSVKERGIREAIEWKFQCIGCKKIYDTTHKTCTECGSKLRRIRVDPKIESN